MARVQTVAQTEQTARPWKTAVRNLAVMGRSCTNCGSTQIRPSNRRTALDILLACVFLAPFRCRICHNRFYRIWRPSLRHPADPSALPVLMDPPPAPRMLFIPAPPQGFGMNQNRRRAIEPPRIDPKPIWPKHNQSQYMPLTRENEVTASVPSGASHPVGATPTNRVVILESDLSIRKLLRRLLERRGYAAVEISQPAELCPLFRDRQADLLIADISDRGEISAECVLALANEHRSLKILALSAEPLRNEIPERLLVLPKPFALDSFVDSVAGLLK